MALAFFFSNENLRDATRKIKEIVVIYLSWVLKAMVSILAGPASIFSQTRQWGSGRLLGIMCRVDSSHYNARIDFGGLSTIFT